MPWDEPNHPRHGPAAPKPPSQRFAAQQNVVDDRTVANVAKLEKEAKAAKAELEKFKKGGQDNSTSPTGDLTADATDAADAKLLDEFRVLEAKLRRQEAAAKDEPDEPFYVQTISKTKAAMEDNKKPPNRCPHTG